ncbi:type IV pilus assembly protein PilW [Oxalobacteraceae bacterium GrIS 2.11]
MSNVNLNQQIHRLGDSRRVRQSGFSLIELMVAVVIGLFITLGLTQMFVNMYSTSQSQNNLYEYQENQRQGIVLLMHSAQLAGYYASTPSATVSASTILVAQTNSGDGTTFVAGAGIVGKKGYPATGTDSIDIYYQTSGADNIINCQGGVATVPTLVINSFYINSSNQLVCTVTLPPAAPSTPLVLANNVGSMTISYGIDKISAGTTDALLDATAVQTNVMWPSVRAIQVTLNFCTGNIVNSASTACSATSPWVQTINLMSKS